MPIPQLEAMLLTWLIDGDKQSSLLCDKADKHGYHFRQVDRSLARLQKQGKIVSLKRISGVRPFPLWHFVEQEQSF